MKLVYENYLGGNKLSIKKNISTEYSMEDEAQWNADFRGCRLRRQRGFSQIRPPFIPDIIL